MLGATAVLFEQVAIEVETDERAEVRNDVMLQLVEADDEVLEWVVVLEEIEVDELL